MEMFFAANTAFAGFVLYTSLKASLLIALVLLARRLFAPRLSAQGHYLLWLAVVTSLVTPLGFTTVIPQVPALSSLATASIQSVDSDRGQALPQQSVTESLRDRSIPSHGRVDAALPQPANDSIFVTLRETLPLGWLSGVLLFIGMVLVKHYRFTKVVNAAVPADFALQALLDDCRQQANCQQDVQLLCSSDIDSPLVTGCFRSSLLLPAELAGQLSEAQLRHVFMHELMHVSNHDIIANWLLTLLQALHWFNPLVWFGFKQLRFDRELARDAATLNHLESGDGEEYGLTLLQLSHSPHRHSGTVSALGIAEDHTQLRRRIVMIVQSSLPARFRALLTGLLMLLFGTMAFSMPTLDSGNQTQEASVAAPALTTTAQIAELPVLAAPTQNTVANTMADFAAPLPKTLASKRVVPVDRAAAASTATAQTKSEKIRNEFTAPAAPAITLALAATAEPAVNVEAEATINSVAAKQETYPGWNDIQTLAKTSAEARDSGLNFIREWNEKFEACSIPLKDVSWQVVYLRLGSYTGCTDLAYAVTRRDAELSGFVHKCVDFLKTYNNLATNVSRAQKSQFVDQAAVKRQMLTNYRTIGEFCIPDVYRQQYPKMAALLDELMRADMGRRRAL